MVFKIYKLREIEFFFNFQQDSAKIKTVNNVNYVHVLIWLILGVIIFSI